MTTESKSPVVLLLVEDDKDLGMMLNDALADEGFEVVLVKTGKKAMAEIEADGARFKAVITDVRLGPGPNGWDVGRRARENVAGVPVIYMSGDSAAEWTAHGVPESIMLQKPFVVPQLITAITTLLNQSSQAAAMQGLAGTDNGKGL